MSNVKVSLNIETVTFISKNRSHGYIKSNRSNILIRLRSNHYLYVYFCLPIFWRWYQFGVFHLKYSPVIRVVESKSNCDISMTFLYFTNTILIIINTILIHTRKTFKVNHQFKSSESSCLYKGNIFLNFG